MNSTEACVSIGGSVFGMQAIEVKPPASAAAVPVAMVSASSRPGSRRGTCMSMKPGQTILPAPASVRAAGRAGRVERAVGVQVGPRPDAGHPAVADPEVGDPVEVLRRVDDAAVADASNH